MKKGIACILAFALALGMMLSVPLTTRAETEPDELVKESFTALSDVNNAHMDMDMSLELNIIIAYGGQQMSMPMSLALNASWDEQMKPLFFGGSVFMNVSTMGNAQTQNALIYAEQSDGVLAIYSSEDDGASWKVSTSEGSETPQIDPGSVVPLILSNLKEVQAAGTELVDGTETLVCSGRLDTAFMQQIMEMAGASEAMAEMTEETGLDADLFSNLGDIAFTVNIDPNTHLPLKYTMDFTDMLKNVMGSLFKTLMGMGDMEGYEINVEIGTARMEIRMRDYNALPGLTVPEDIKAAAVATELVEVAVTP